MNHLARRREYHEAYSDYADKKARLSLLLLAARKGDLPNVDLEAVIAQQRALLEVAWYRYDAAKQAFINGILDPPISGAESVRSEQAGLKQPAPAVDSLQKS